MPMTPKAPSQLPTTAFEAAPAELVLEAAAEVAAEEALAAGPPG